MTRGTENSAIRFVEVAPSNPSAATFLLLHGLGGSLEIWTDVMGRLGAVARTVAVDIPWFGQSRDFRGSFDLDEAAARISEFCRTQAMSDCVIVATSTGGMVAAKVATLLDGAVTRLILVDATLGRATALAQHPLRAMRDPRFGVLVAAQFLLGMIPSIPVRFLSALTRPPVLRRVIFWPFVAHPERIPTASIIRTLTGGNGTLGVRILLHLRSFDYRAVIASIRQPVDLIWGGRDLLIAPEDVDEVRHLVAVARECEVVDCGHWPWLECPSMLTDFILGATSASKEGQR